MSTASPGFQNSLRLSLIFIVFAGSFSRANELEEIGPCTYVATDWADGDSFLVKLPDGKEQVFRLYYVDCIEQSVSDTSDKRRLREQSRYFGVTDYLTAVEHGRKAADFTAEALSRPFTIHTAYADARGRSGKPRFYAFVRTSEGRDLGHLLLENGLARAFGLGRETPGGTSRDEWDAYLKDIELVAAIGRQGIWAHSDPAQIVAMRKEEREEMRGLEAIDDALVVAPPSEPVDVNTASIEDLMRTGLRESLADAVVKKRPFEKIEDLLDVKGIGPVTFQKVRPYLVVTTPPTRKPAP
jgi:competence protein ComEA